MYRHVGIGVFLVKMLIVVVVVILSPGHALMMNDRYYVESSRIGKDRPANKNNNKGCVMVFVETTNSIYASTVFIKQQDKRNTLKLGGFMYI